VRLDWDWELTVAILPRLAGAFRVTLLATVLGVTLALVLGLAVALLRRSAPRPVAAIVGLVVEFLRSTPLLIQIYFLFYVMPQFGITLSPLVTGVLSLGVHYSAYMSEVYRAGIDSVPAGQWDAAKALNLGRLYAFRRVILPQALPPVVPALGNYFIAMFKDTPMLSTITVLELLNVARTVGSETFRYVEPLTLVGVFFLAASLLAALGIRAVEHRMARGIA
jgi:polar amino acid transport system permease protein